MVKDWDQLTISNDFIFNRVMEKNPGICKRLLELILEFEIDEIVYPEREKTLTEHGLSKGIRLDVYVQSKDGRKHFDVEIQTSKKHELGRRMRYYQSTIDFNALNKGQHYYELGESYIIFICTFDYFGAERYKYVFRQKCEDDTGILLNDGATKIILNSKGKLGEIDGDLQAFLQYVGGLKVENSFVDELDDAVKLVKQSRIERADYMHYTEHIAEEKFFARNEGIEIGLAKGVERGRAEGVERGRAEGVELGREQEKIAMIKKFWAAGTPINFIEEATGLSKEQIEGIIKAD